MPSQHYSPFFLSITYLSIQSLSLKENIPSISLIVIIREPFTIPTTIFKVIPMLKPKIIFKPHTHAHSHNHFQSQKACPRFMLKKQNQKTLPHPASVSLPSNNCPSYEAHVIFMSPSLVDSGKKPRSESAARLCGLLCFGIFIREFPGEICPVVL